MKRVLFFSSLLACSFCVGAEEEQDLYNKDVSSFFINAEALYWTAQADCLDFAWVGTASASAGLDGRYHKADFKWKPGVRVSAGYFNAPKYWEFQLQYTWEYIKGSKTINRPSGGYILSCWPNDADDLISQAKNHAALHYQTWDGVAARVFIPNPHFRLRFLGGLTTARMKENFNTWFYGSINNSRIETMWKYWGIGFKVGTFLDWFLGKDFYLTGKCAFASLMGYHKSSIYYRISGEDSAIEYTRDKGWRPAFMTQFFGGPSWQRSFGKYRVEVFAGYEFNGWFNVLEVLGMIDESTSALFTDLTNRTETEKSMLGLHGLTCRVSFNF